MPPISPQQIQRQPLVPDRRQCSEQPRTLDGLGEEQQQLSKHLRIRQEVGHILRESGAQVIEFRASIVIGSGSLSFELIRALVQKLPVMLCMLNGIATTARRSAEPATTWQPTVLRQVAWLIGFIAVCFASAGLGAAVTSTSVAGWYQTLAKPSWNLPAWLFGVWSKNSAALESLW